MIAGYASLVLGVIGIFVPLLPTTPLLLLAAACFLRSSDSLYRWLTQHRLFGSYILNYQKYRAVSKKTKFVALLVLWTSITISVLFIVPLLWVKVALVVVALGVTIHILRLRTVTREMREKRQ
jgi:uncharacterized membrane protein YbaN (DUF454 family)